MANPRRRTDLGSARAGSVGRLLRRRGRNGSSRRELPARRESGASRPRASQAPRPILLRSRPQAGRGAAPGAGRSESATGHLRLRHAGLGALQDRSPARSRGRDGASVEARHAAITALLSRGNDLLPSRRDYQGQGTADAFAGAKSSFFSIGRRPGAKNAPADRRERWKPVAATPASPE